jgi:hypothetical protein
VEIEYDRFFEGDAAMSWAWQHMQIEPGYVITGSVINNEQNRINNRYVATANNAIKVLWAKRPGFQFSIGLVVAEFPSLFQCFWKSCLQLSCKPVRPEAPQTCARRNAVLADGELAEVTANRQDRGRRAGRRSEDMVVLAHLVQ